MRVVSLSKALAAASVNNIATSQSVAGGALVSLNGSAVVAGVAVLDTQRRIIITSGGNDSANTATIIGTNQTGQLRAEVLALTNGGTAQSVLDYLTITSIRFTSASASTIQVGTNTVGSTEWIMPSFALTPFDVNINTQLSGSVTYSIETTNDVYEIANTGLGATNPQPNVFAFTQGDTVGMRNVLDDPVRGIRFTITAGTGTLTAQVDQAGITNR